MIDDGRIPDGTGLAGAEAPEPHSRLGPSDGIPCAERMETFTAYPAIVGVVAEACYDQPDARALADKIELPDFGDAEESVQAFWRHIAKAALVASGHWELIEALIDWRNTYLCPESDIEKSASRLLETTDAALALARAEQVSA